MRNASKILASEFIALRSARICLVFFLLATLFPDLAIGQSGQLGSTSTGSSRISIVIPEHFEPREVRLKGDKLLACGDFPADLSFLSIEGNSVNKLTHVLGASGCQDGQTFVAPFGSGAIAIMLPSAAS